MATGFDRIAQSDWASGMWQAVARHLIPRNGTFDLLNTLLDDDGLAYRRGGSEYKSNAGLGTAGLRWIWDGQLSPGARTLVASATKFGVLDADDATILDIGTGAGATGLAGPTRAAQVGDLLFIGGGTIYGGSRKTANYSTGTVTTTLASKTLTGAGTSWSANVDAGMLFRVSGERVYVVASVDSNTQITLTEPYQGTSAAGKAYTLKQLELATTPYKTAEIYATIFDRLLVATGKRLDPSASDDAAGLTQPHLFSATEFENFPADILAIEALRDTALIFTAAGVFSWTGAAFDETDDAGNAQWSFERVNPDLILWAKEGVATYQNQLVVPCADGVWTVGVASAPQLLSKSVQARYLSAVRGGSKPGGAGIFKSHYVLPILDSSNAVVDMIVCRLDRPTDTDRGVIFPWTRQDGHGGNVTCVAPRVGGAAAARSPELLGASKATGSRILKLGGFWEPTAARKNDADGTTQVWRLETRDYATGAGNENTVRQLIISYELIDAASDNPHIQAAYSKGAELPGLPHWDDDTWDDVLWVGDDAEFIQLPDGAPEDNGRTPFIWSGFAASTRYVRARLQCSDPCASLKLRSLDWRVMSSGKQ